MDGLSALPSKAAREQSWAYPPPNTETAPHAELPSPVPPRPKNVTAAIATVDMRDLMAGLLFRNRAPSCARCLGFRAERADLSNRLQSHIARPQDVRRRGLIQQRLTGEISLEIGQEVRLISLMLRARHSRCVRRH